MVHALNTILLNYNNMMSTQTCSGWWCTILIWAYTQNNTHASRTLTHWNERRFWFLMHFTFRTHTGKFGYSTQNIYLHVISVSFIIILSYWICILHVLSSLLMYITLMYQKKINFDLFLHENFHFTPWSFDSQLGQNYSS